MKKTLVVVMAMVLGLSMTASALPEVTVDQCSGVFDMQLEFQLLIGILGGEIDGLPPAEAIDLEGEGLPDYAKITLLAAAMCEDEDLAAAFDDNKTAFMAMPTALFALIDWAALTVAPTNAAAAALPTFTGNPAYMGALQAALAGLGMTPQEIAGVVIMLTDEVTAEALELPYIPTALADLAAELTGLGTELPANPYYAFAGALATVVPNGFTAWMSVSSELQANLIGLVEAELLADIRDYQDVLGQVAQIFAALAYVSQNLIARPDLAVPFGLFALALDAPDTGGVTIMESIALPAVPILGAIGKAEGEPFSALGDYDGDEINNVTTWDAVGGDMALFIAGASGANPFYPNNPLMPAAGLIGLAALISAIAGGGAFVLRKK